MNAAALIPFVQIAFLRESHGKPRGGIPSRYDGSIEEYRYVEIEYDNQKTVFENCYRHLRTLRNNIIHANKAYRPDTPERLDDLLEWSAKFIQSVYATHSDLATRAMEIKAVLKIETF